MMIFGLIGEKLSHSLSPKIHTEVFKAFSMNAKYNLFSIEKTNIKNAVISLKTLGIKGANVTIPYKEEVMSQLDVISDEAKKIGAVNTIHIKDGKSYGYNTDYYGFKKMLLKDDVKIKGNDFYVLGAGGAAKAIVHLLLDEGARVFLVSRNKAAAKSKFSNIDINFLSYDDMKNIDNAYALVNTTPCGMYPNISSTALDRDILKKFSVACDIIYNPEETRFLKEAKEEGLKVVKGLYMLVAQAIKSEEIWNDIKIEDSIEEAIFNMLGERFR